MSVLSSAAALAVQVLFIWFIYRIWKKSRQPPAATRSGPAIKAIKGGDIRPLATFTGVRGLPWIALASNNLNPVLRVEEEQLVFRVLRQQHRPYDEICEVDVREAYGTFNLVFSFHGTSFTFTANVRTAARGAEALALLPASVPLSAQARSALQTPAT